MANQWQPTMITILRYLVNDFDSDSYTYSDSRLEELILIAAHLIQKEVSFENSYTIDIDQAYITPNPVEVNDAAFINLVCLKAAVLLTRNELKTKSLGSLSWSDGPSSLNTTSVFTSFQKLYEALNDNYEQARLQFMMGSRPVGRGIFGPMSSYNLLNTGEGFAF